MVPISALRPGLAAAVIAFACLFPIPSLQAVDGDLAPPLFRYYDVDAQGSDLLAAINRATPVREEGRRFHAYTRWVVEWRLQWQPGILGECRIGAAQVNLSGAITLPRLVAGDAEQEERFGRYIAALRRHELGHYVNGRLAAMAVEQKLESLGPMDDCDSLRQAANGAARSAVEYYQSRDREYDEETMHGRTQGAALDS